MNTRTPEGQEVESSNKSFLLEDIYRSKYYFESMLFFNSLLPNILRYEFYKLINVSILHQ
jgi:hypothetical protein